MLFLFAANRQGLKAGIQHSASGSAMIERTSLAIKEGT
jgi:hypothetical protein